MARQKKMNSQQKPKQEALDVQQEASKEDAAIERLNKKRKQNQKKKR